MHSSNVLMALASTNFKNTIFKLNRSSYKSLKNFKYSKWEDDEVPFYFSQIFTFKNFGLFYKNIFFQYNYTNILNILINKKKVT